MADKSDRLKNMSEEELDARHAEKMKKKKEPLEKLRMKLLRNATHLW